MKIIFLMLLLVSTASTEAVRGINGVLTKDNINNRVGINLATGTDPAYTLDVNGIVNATSLIGTVTGAASLNVLKTGDTMIGPLTLSGSTLTVTGNAFSVGGSTLVVSAGMLGIGITPSYGLHIAKGLTDNPNSTLAIEKVSGGNYAFTIQDQGNNGFIQYVGYAGALNMNGTAIRLNPSATGNVSMVMGGGNVGIGTTAPADKLDISSGTIRITGTGTPPAGQALCLGATGRLGTCTLIVLATGVCTCTEP